MRTIKLFFIFTCLLLGFQVGFANNTNNNSDRLRRGTDINVFGHVIDKATGEHLPYVVVQLKGTTLGTTTDATGHYMLKNLPAGKHTLVVNAIGYFTNEQTLNLKDHQSYEVNFELTEDKLAISETVVTANREATLRVKAPVIVNIIDNKLLSKTASTSLAQGLVFQPGIRIEDNCQNCGFSQVRINGLDGNYSQILINSRPVFSSLNGVYGLEQIPANMIDRVEVVRGGGSALYGSSAIGGTINIITKEPTRNSVEFSQLGTAIYDFHNLASNTNLNASVVSDDNNAGLYVYGSHSYRPGVDLNGDGYTELPTLRNITVGGRAFFKIDTQSKISAEFHALNEFRRGGNKLDVPAHEANIAEQIQNNIVGGALNYDFFSYDGHHKLNAYVAFHDNNRNSYYGGAADINQGDKTIIDYLDGTEDNNNAIAAALGAYGKTHELVLNSGLQYTYAFDKLLFMPANLTLGAEYLFDNMNDKSFGMKINNTQKIHDFSFYAQNEWVNDEFSILLGVRVDQHSKLRKPVVSPRFTLRYRPVEFINLRASYSAGFRAPQVFDEDLHTSLAGGDRVRIVNGKDLRPEYSHSFNLSADTYFNIGKVKGNFLVDGFYTRLVDAFVLNSATVDDEIIKTRVNSSNGANVFGANIEAKLAYERFAQIQGGITIQRSLYTRAEEVVDGLAPLKDFLRTPDLYGYFIATVRPVKNLSLNFSGTYTGRMYVVKNKIDDESSVIINKKEVVIPTRPNSIVRTPNFFTLDCKLAYDIKLYNNLVNMQIFGGIKNMFNSYQKDFDLGYTRDSEYIYGPTTPRSFFLGLKFNY